MTAKVYGWYSAEMAKQSPPVLYHTRDGRVVEVTIVTQDTTHPGARWADMQALGEVVGITKARTCLACKHCFMEPDDDFCCGHPDAGPIGTYVKHAAAPGGHCGRERPKFEQHPQRNPDGTLKP